MSTDTFTFEILPGINTSVTLNLEWEFIRTLEALPPHTAVMKEHASIYWGENFHGSLNETYYFTWIMPPIGHAGFFGSETTDPSVMITAHGFLPALGFRFLTSS